MEYIRLKLTLPPTLNGLFAGYRVRHKSNIYKEWLKLAHSELLQQERYTITGDEWLEVNYAFYMPIYNKNGTKKRVDVFNFEKALSDFLADNISWFKDEHIKKWFIEKHDSKEKYVIIFIKECNDTQKTI